jgi:uncharacterized protein (TIGR02246 family)
MLALGPWSCLKDRVAVRNVTALARIVVGHNVTAGIVQRSVTGEIMDQTTQILATIDAMTRAFNEGDIDGVMRTYEQGAVVVGQPGARVGGAQALRSMFAGFIAAKAHFTFRGHEVVQAGDIAVHFTPWRMTGVAPDQSAIESDGLSVAVLRRQTNGRWLMVIDNPFGDWLQKRTVAGCDGG